LEFNQLGGSSDSTARRTSGVRVRAWTASSRVKLSATGLSFLRLAFLVGCRMCSGASKLKEDAFGATTFSTKRLPGGLRL